MAAHVGRWWSGYFIDNPLCHLLHKPEKIVGPYARLEMTVMDAGCGMGLFSIAMAKMVGQSGLAIAVASRRMRAAIAPNGASPRKSIRGPGRC